MKPGDIIKWVAGGLGIVLMSVAVILLQSLDSQISQLRGQLYDIGKQASQEIRELSERIASLEARRR